MSTIENTNGQPADPTQHATAANTNGHASTAPPPAPPNGVPTGPDGAPLFVQGQGESDRAFEAFLTYLALGPKRRVAAVGRKLGTSLRTVQRWAKDFDWRGRVKSCAAHRAERFLETEALLQQEEQLDAAQRDRSLRQRQSELADAFLLAAERFLEGVDDDLEEMSFADACKAVEAAARLRRAVPEEDDGAAAPNTTLRDQLTSLLEQAYSEVTAEQAAAASPTPSNSAPAIHP